MWDGGGLYLVVCSLKLPLRRKGTGRNLTKVALYIALPVLTCTVNWSCAARRFCVLSKPEAPGVARTRARLDQQLGLP
jgi:hypothetical protein